MNDGFNWNFKKKSMNDLKRSGRGRMVRKGEEQQQQT